MFGIKRRRRKLSKREQIATMESPRTIIFRGKKYWKLMDTFTYADAKNKAKKAVQSGYTVRIIGSKYSPTFEPGKWVIYVNPDPHLRTRL